MDETPNFTEHPLTQRYDERWMKPQILLKHLSTQRSDERWTKPKILLERLLSVSGVIQTRTREYKDT